MINLRRKLALSAILAWILSLVIISSADAKPSPAMNCTFTSKYPVISLREGPGTTYERVGFMQAGDTLNVVDQQAGADGYIWWKGANNAWVRSDLGTSDCPSTCGNTVCEYGETAAICAQDCQGSSTSISNSSTLQKTATGCIYSSCEACYDAFPCWPNACTKKTCTLNQYGCPVCQTAP